MRIELTDHERGILARLVHTRIAELGPEIHHTSSRSVRNELRELQEAFERVEHKLTDPNLCEI